MGSGRWDPTDWAHYARSTAGRSTADIFAARLHRALDPRGVVRESRDSADNPQSHAIAVALDVTGSMGMIADALARRGLGTLVEEILRRKPVTDPHVMFMGVGDAYFDQAPLQVTQFEADIRIAEQLKDLWLEKGGGGNNSESYTLPWWFAAMNTSIDCFEKRGKKGYLFTVGDEEPPPILLAKQIRDVVGGEPRRDMSARELLELASRSYHVFHVVVEEGSYASSNLSHVLRAWRGLLGQRVLQLADHTRLAEVIVSAIEVNEGRDADSVSASWSGDTAAVVRRAMRALVPAKARDNGVVRF
jgi:hypothetical protein